MSSQRRSCTFGRVCVSGSSAADLALRHVTRRLNKDDRTLEMPEDPAIGAAFQQHKLRRSACVVRSRTRSVARARSLRRSRSLASLALARARLLV